MNRLRTQRRDRGATMVGFALVAPLFFFIIFGMLEFGIVFYNNTVIEGAAREGARRVSVDPGESGADLRLFETLERTAGHLSGDLQTVIVANVGSVEAAVPSACYTNSVPNVCTRWEITDGDILGSYVPSLMTGWEPGQREGGDVLILTVEYTTESPTGLFSNVAQRYEVLEIMEGEW